jgi:hypothetical protein
VALPEQISAQASRVSKLELVARRGLRRSQITDYSPSQATTGADYQCGWATSAGVIITVGSSCEFRTEDQGLAFRDAARVIRLVFFVGENVDELHQLLVGHHTRVWKGIHGFWGVRLRRARCYARRKSAPPDLDLGSSGASIAH